MAAEADGAAEVEVSPTGWVARQAELYESSGGT
ncbi:nitroreductase family deazaflavin-dependent oxidoreductase, partial [Streptomyces sp. IB2014 011-12]